MNTRTACGLLLAILAPHAPGQGQGATAAGTPEPPPSFSFAIDTPDPALQDEVLAGLHDLVCYWDEEAYRHFSHVVKIDQACAMAHWGLIMSAMQDPSRQKECAASIEALGILAERGDLLPRERGYASALSALLKNDTAGATSVLKDLSARYRNDPMAALFHLLLMRDGYDELGLPRNGQKEALQLADELAARYPDKHAFRFIRALLEETAPEISPAALAAAHKAVELAPGHPVSRHLLGHLLFRSGKLEEAQAEFLRAAELFRDTLQQQSGDKPETISYDRADGYIRSMLYLSTTMWCRHKDADAAAIIRKLMQQPYRDKASTAAGSMLYRWEVRTLPLRLAICGGEKYDKELLGQWEKQARISPPLPRDNPAELFFDLQRACATAAGLARDHQADRAQYALLTASQLHQQLSLPAEGIQARKNGELSCFTRALASAQTALMQAQAAGAGDKGGLWNRYADDARRAATLLLPPAMPTRSPAAPEKETPAARPAAPSATPSSGEPRKVRTVKKSSKPAARKNRKGKKMA